MYIEAGKNPTKNYKRKGKKIPTTYMENTIYVGKERREEKKKETTWKHPYIRKEKKKKHKVIHIS